MKRSGAVHVVREEGWRSVWEMYRVGKYGRGSVKGGDKYTEGVRGEVNMVRECGEEYMLKECREMHLVWECRRKLCRLHSESVRGDGYGEGVYGSDVFSMESGKYFVRE